MISVSDPILNTLTNNLKSKPPFNVQTVPNIFIGKLKMHNNKINVFMILEFC